MLWSSIYVVIEEVIVRNYYNIWEGIQLVIVIVIITKNTLVFGNCNDYSLQVIVTTLIYITQRVTYSGLQTTVVLRTHIVNNDVSLGHLLSHVYTCIYMHMLLDPATPLLTLL